MWNQPDEPLLRQVPALYATERTSAEGKVIWLHFFFGDCDWYVAEYDGDDLFFGFVVLHGDLMNAEWGYFALSELVDIEVYGFEVDRDIHWVPVPAGKIDRIREWL